MDSVGSWQAGDNKLTADPADKKEGKASLKAEGSGIVRFQQNFANPAALKFPPDEAYLCFSIFISDINTITSEGQLEISSSGKPDDQELSWPISALSLKNGWNEVALKLSTAGATNGAIDYAKINFLRMYAFPKDGAATIFKLDNLRFTDFFDNGHVVNSNFHIYILAGQSNMAGYGYLTDMHPTLNVAYSTISNDRIKVMNDQNEWVTAKHPLHIHEGNNSGVGPGLDFAMEMLKGADPNVTIGVIPTAVGGSPIATWVPGANLYGLSLSKALYAQTDGVIKGVLFLQGEADAFADATDGWGDKVKLTIAGYRKELKTPALKFMIGEIGRNFAGSDKVNFPKINAQIPAIVQAVPNTYLISSEGLTDRGDALHYNSKSATVLGQRYAAAIKGK